MVTTVGHETQLSDMLENLITLEHDAIQAYDAAIDQLQDKTAQDKLREFRKDHERHIEDLTPHLSGMGVAVPDSSGAKRVLTEGKVHIAAVAGDRAVLTAMGTNEVETEAAYRTAAERDDVDTKLRDKLRAAEQDETRHKTWIQDRV